MGILDSIKDLANQAVESVKDVVEDVQEKAVELKADFDEAGGAQGLLNQAGDKLSELGHDISETASSVVETATAKANELKDSVVDAVKGDDEAPKA
ncbi:MAG: hypothetical protein ACRCV6_05575 [Formosimonas sp.]